MDKIGALLGLRGCVFQLGLQLADGYGACPDVIERDSARTDDLL